MPPPLILLVYWLARANRTTVPPRSARGRGDSAERVRAAPRLAGRPGCFSQWVEPAGRSPGSSPGNVVVGRRPRGP
jgi:hypothetical protein